MRSSSILLLIVFALAGRSPLSAQPARLQLDSGAGVAFGAGVEHSDPFLLIGAPGDAESRGAAHLFRRSRHGWVAVERLQPPHPARSKAFADEVAIDGRTAAIADPMNGDILPEAGLVHIFQSDETGRWVHVKEVRPPDLDIQQLWFGRRLALRGDTLLVGAPGYSGTQERQGVVYVFARHHGGRDAWGLVTRLLAPDAKAFDMFSTVLLDGSYAIVGSPSADLRAGHGGAVYVFKRQTDDPSLWNFLEKMTASDGLSGDAFGTRIALRGDRILIGAPGARRKTGAVYLFARSGDLPGSWREDVRLTAPDGRVGDAYGTSVALGDQWFAIGAPGHDAAGEESGAVYVHDNTFGGPTTRGTENPRTEPVRLTQPSGTVRDRFGWAVTSVHDRLLAAAPNATHAAGIVYEYDLSASHGATLLSFDHLIPPPVHEEKFHVETFLQDRRGFLWLGTADGLARHDGYEYQHYRHDPQDSTTIAPGMVLSILEDREGRMWVGTEVGLCRFERETGRFIQYRLSHANRSHQSIRVLFEDRDGTVWTGANGRIYHYNSTRDGFDEYEPFTGPPDALDEPYVSGIQQSGDGLLWILAKNLWKPRASLYRVDLTSDAVRRYSVPPAWGWVGPLFIDGSDRMWLKMPAPVLLPLHDRPALPEPPVQPVDAAHWSFLEDANGTVWAATRQGVYRLSEDESRASFHRISPSNPLANTVWSLHIDGAGRLLFGTSHGVYALSNLSVPVASERVDSPEVAPYEYPLALTNVHISNRQGKLGITPHGLDELTLSHREYHLSFEYAALIYARPEHIHYRYRLDGFDEDWIEAGVLRRATYTHVPPGRYTLRVEAVPDDGLPRIGTLTLPVTIRPPFWQTWWFRILGIAAVAGLLAGAYRYRVQRLLEIERLRLRLASDLHDDLSSDLSGIALGTDVLLQRPYLHADDRRRLVDVRGTALRMVDALRDLVWYIDPEHDTVEDLTLRMKVTAGMLLNGTPYHFTGTASSTNGILPMALRRQVFLIYKEALHNAARHSDASHVAIHLDRTDELLVVEVRDNGSGFNPDSTATGYGLKNMRGRANEIGADLEIRSRPGDGTTVRLAVDIARTRDINS